MKRCPVGIVRSEKNREHVNDFRVVVDWGDTVVFKTEGTAATVMIPNAGKLFGDGAEAGRDYLVGEIAAGDTWETPTVKESAGGTKEQRKKYPYAVYCQGRDEFAEKQGNTSPVMLIGPP
jgi:hypothetical protein